MIGFWIIHTFYKLLSIFFNSYIWTFLISYSDCINKPNPKINVVYLQHPWCELFLPLKDKMQLTIFEN